MRPGVWYASDDSFSKVRGTELFPDEGAFETPGSPEPTAPAETLGIGYLQSGVVVIAYVRFDPNVTAAEMERTLGAAIIEGYYLAVFKDDGTYLGTAEIETDNVSAFATVPGTDRVLFTRYTQFAQVVGAHVLVSRFDSN
jgi:hypothetical protein